MAKEKVTDLVSRQLEPFLAENGYELFLVEFVKEGKDWFLRIYIDAPQGVGISDCEKVSRYISDWLDEKDPIQQPYCLEVSSPGLDRPLIRERDFTTYQGRLVDITLYRAIDGKKQMTWELVGLRDGLVAVKDETGRQWEIPRENISKIRLAIVF